MPRKKDYLVIAKAMKRVAPHVIDDISSTMRHQWVKDCLALSSDLYKNDPHDFDKAQFEIDCGIEG